MSNTSDRRRFLASGTAFVGLYFAAGSSLAGVGSESDRSSQEHSKWLDAIRYSQTEFLKLNRDELTYLYNYKIDGFYDAMASNIVKMMLSDRASTRRLMQDMGEAENENARKERLVAEMRRAIDLEEAARGRQLRRAKVYKRGVKTWLRYPREGTFFAKCLFSVGNKSWDCNP